MQPTPYYRQRNDYVAVIHKFSFYQISGQSLKVAEIRLQP